MEPLRDEEFPDLADPTEVDNGDIYDADAAPDDELWDSVPEVPLPVAPPAPSEDAPEAVAFAATEADYAVSMVQEVNEPEVSFYEVQSRTISPAGAWRTVSKADPEGNGIDVGRLPSGVPVEARLRATYTNGAHSDWSTPIPIGLPLLQRIPERPSTPMIEEGVGIVLVTWDGLMASGSSAPPEYRATVVWTKTGAEDWKRATSIVGAGEAALTLLPLDTPSLVAMTVIDRFGNESPMSVAVEATPMGVVDNAELKVELEALQLRLEEALAAISEVQETFVTSSRPPGPVDAQGRPDGVLWSQVTGGVEVGRWALRGGQWVQVSTSPEIIPNLVSETGSAMLVDVGRLRASNLDMDVAAANKIFVDMFKANKITAAQIASNSLTAANLGVGSLAASLIVAGAFDAQAIVGTDFVAGGITLNGAPTEVLLSSTQGWENGIASGSIRGGRRLSSASSLSGFNGVGGEDVEVVTYSDAADGTKCLFVKSGGTDDSIGIGEGTIVATIPPAMRRPASDQLAIRIRYKYKAWPSDSRKHADTGWFPSPPTVMLAREDVGKFLWPELDVVKNTHTWPTSGSAVWRDAEIIARAGNVREGVIGAPFDAVVFTLATYGYGNVYYDAFSVEVMEDPGSAYMTSSSELYTNRAFGGKGLSLTHDNLDTGYDIPPTYLSVPVKEGILHPATFGNSLSNRPRYERRGHVVMLSGIAGVYDNWMSAGLDVDTNGGANLGYLPLAVAPPTEVRSLQQGSGTNRHLLTVGTNGSINISRYTGVVYKMNDIMNPPPKNSIWLPYSASWIV